MLFSLHQLTKLLALGALLVGSGESKTWDIDATSYSSPYCGDGKIGKTKPYWGTGKCHDMPRGDEPTQSFFYGFYPHHAGESSYKYGDCTIEFYAGRGCGGNVVKREEHANSFEGGDPCVHDFSSPPGSLRIICNK